MGRCYAESRWSVTQSLPRGVDLGGGRIIQRKNHGTRIVRLEKKKSPYDGIVTGVECTVDVLIGA